MRRLAGGGFGVQPDDLKIFSTFTFTAASILISGGQGRLRSSPGIFFVASMPNLLPLVAQSGMRSRRNLVPFRNSGLKQMNG